ncbi:unnamed protein product [Cylindrotheca closterium]|uniref:Uncharacterized protein n=1 Tax=Cylindrotheca closterium TaxID=2856 RepID=A0AAD2CJL3_9STRA|nr:unnamed protein product [Cylindrotheca closterium]
MKPTKPFFRRVVAVCCFFLTLICKGYAFSFPLMHPKGSRVLCLYRRNIVGLGIALDESSTQCELCAYDKAFEVGSSLLDAFANGQVSEDVALPGIRMTSIPPETNRILQEIEQVQDLVMDEAFQVSFEKEEESYYYSLPPPYLSNSSTSSSSRWVQVLPELQDLFTEAFQAVVESHRLLNESSGVQLSPYDLFHGHLFRRSTYHQKGTVLYSKNETHIQSFKNQEDEQIEIGSPHHQLGILFHCCEYPAMDNPQGILEGIPLGNDQVGSTCQPTLEEWKFRNVLWLAGWQNIDGRQQREESSSSSSLSLQQPPNMWLLNGSAPEISQLQMDGSEFGPQSPNTVWEGFLVANKKITATDARNGNNGDNYTQCGGLVADLYYCTESGSIWCKMC